MALNSSTLLLLCFCFLVSCASASNVSHDERAILIDGKRRVLLSGSIHYPRSTAEMWPDLIKKSKDGGLDAIETYVFWDVHEPARRQYDFIGNLDLVRFIKTIQDEGLYSILRIGPYVCAEWNYGGLPVWLHNMPNIEIRTNNDVFMNEMKNFTSLIVNMLKKERLFASQGGPIILAQIENEYGNVMDVYGEDGKVYIDWCAKMATSLDIGVPWIMCQQKDAPKPMLETCNGWYCHQYTPTNPSTPKMWTENWTGWFKSWGGADPHRTAEDVAYSVARFFQVGGTLQNYYMYHGGTNFGRAAGGPYITTTYDYDAPLNEYGQLSQPKYGHLKQLHEILHSMEKTLTYGNVSQFDLGSAQVTMYTTEDGSGCFLSNENTIVDAKVTFQGVEYFVPAWSVSISTDCKTETYNTAKVSTQTSVMVKKNNDEESSTLSWSWRPEKLDKTILLGQGHVSANQLIDQKRAANDASDYLWYMTSVDIKDDDLIWSNNMSIRVNTTGQVVHLYLNGKYIGSHWEKYDVLKAKFIQNVKLNHGRNLISLLSATVGLKNYGPRYDTINAGINPGPIELIGYKDEDERVIKDLSSNKWSYRVGLHGLNNKLYDLNSPSTSKWATEAFPTNKMMTWYKTTFKTPIGMDPVVVDLKGMGKGIAWVNGFNIGRYWPSYMAQDDGCDGTPCDYRGPYDDTKCISKCGEPTQRWYHVPRSVLNEVGNNTLVLFEELGGNPAKVKFQTISVGSVCANVQEGSTLELSCPGQAISEIKFVSFGDPTGVCGSFAKGTCQSENDALSILVKACVGKQTCMIDVSEHTFGTTNCGNIIKRLAIEAIC